jgi:ribosome-binding protein aMBF1 (putative translation factor)
MPAPGWKAADRKPVKLNVPISEEFSDRITAAAVKRGLKRTELARALLEQGLKRMRL